MDEKHTEINTYIDNLARYLNKKYPNILNNEQISRAKTMFNSSNENINSIKKKIYVLARQTIEKYVTREEKQKRVAHIKCDYNIEFADSKMEHFIEKKLEQNLLIDEYLDTEKSYRRLKKEFETHKKLIIAYDLDSTVFDYHNTGASYEMVKDLIRKYKEYAYFIVFTSSEPDRYNEIELILQRENLPYDSINDDAPFIPFKGRKVYYNILLDDRAGLNQTYNELLRLYNEVIINLK